MKQRLLLINYVLQLFLHFSTLCYVLLLFADAAVLEQAGAIKATSTLLLRQLQLFGRIALSSSASPVRSALFKEDSLSLWQTDGQRGRGRPRQYWPEMVRAHAVAAARGEDNLHRLLCSATAKGRARRNEWERIARAYCAKI